MERVAAVIATLLVGGLVAFQPPVNALLGRLVGDLGAAFVSLTLSTAIVGALMLLWGDAGQLAGISGIRPVHLIGGVAGAAIVVATLVAVRVLGAAGVTAALVTMQLTVSVILDRLGVLGLDRTPLDWRVWAGSGLLLAGTLLITTR